MTIKYSIVIPCYNEEKNIPLNFERYQKTITRDDIELILVNNGSQDNSQKVLDAFLPSYPFARTVKVEVNQGYGFGILTGLKAARGEFLAWTHADMQTDPADVIKAIELSEKQRDPKAVFVKGNRHGRGLFEMFFTRGMSLFESILFGHWLHDINAQPNLFHRSFYERWQNPPHDFSLDLFVLVQALKLKLTLLRFDVQFPERQHGASSWNTGLAARLKIIKRTIGYSWKLRARLS